MDTIHKYSLQMLDRQEIALPKGTTVLSVGTPQANETSAIMLWARVDTMQPKEKRVFAIIGTGHRMPTGQLRFIGTVFMARGTLVFHVFEVLD